MSIKTTDTFRQATPKSAGFRMPAEWEPQSAMWMTWPARENTSFPDGNHHDTVLPVFVEMILAITRFQPLYLNCVEPEDRDYLGEKLGSVAPNLHITDIPAVYPWCRDHGSTFVKNDTTGEIAAVNWDYNAWGNKYPEILQRDILINRRMTKLLGLREFEPGFVLEGGSIDVNGSGSVLTTTQCLLNPNRNPHLSRAEIESVLEEYLNVSNVLWLDEGVAGDDTDGHIDDITRFVNADTVVTVVEPDRTDANHDMLDHNLRLLKGMKSERGQKLNIVELPMPSPVVTDGIRLPASYANFYIGNGFILQPVFQDRNDDRAVEIVGSCFPGREIVPINCRDLVWGLGTFHCLTQQQPK
jgi:agmatine deiminase